MARSGFKIFDADTQVRPDTDPLEPFLPRRVAAVAQAF